MMLMAGVRNVKHVHSAQNVSQRHFSSEKGGQKEGNVITVLFLTCVSVYRDSLCK